MRCGKKTVLASTCKAEAAEAGGSFKAAGTGKSHKGCKSKSMERREPLVNCGLRLPDSRRTDEKARETPTSHEHDGAHGADADSLANDILPVDERDSAVGTPPGTASPRDIPRRQSTVTAVMFAHGTFRPATDGKVGRLCARAGKGLLAHRVARSARKALVLAEGLRVVPHAGLPQRLCSPC